MPPSPGDRLGSYEIIGPLGKGGMGEVYRARDAKLNRDVAIKVLPAALANDADYLSRFQREAQALAALHHPNIATIFGLEQNAIVMELIEGATLRGPLKLAEALPLARQIAEALEAAHDKGIIHRDLKPGNIIVTPDGVVKVLDFGLAKAIDIDATLTMGVVMGTPGYMSPEQAAGKPVDRRADIWSFGVVLFELLTGKRLPDGDIDFTAIPEGSIRELVRRCLDRNLKTRLQHIGEARIAIETYAPIRPSAIPRSMNWGLTAALVLIAAAVAGYLTWRNMRPAEKPLARLYVSLGSDVWPDSPLNTAAPFALSPAGDRIAYLTQNHAGVPVLATRSLDQEQASILSDTENAMTPLFSPDGQWIAFAANGQLKKVPVTGGGATVLCAAPLFRGGSWGENGNIFAALDLRSGISLIPVEGGAPRPVTALTGGEQTHRWPQALPGGDAVLFMAGVSGNYDIATIEVASLRTGQRKLLHRGGYFPRYLPSGHLLFMKQEVLYAAPMDLKRLELTGPPVPVLRDVSAYIGGGLQMNIASNGTILYRSTAYAAEHSLEWMDAAGAMTSFFAKPARYQSFQLSPDGKRLAVGIKGNGISVYDSERNTMTRLVADPGLADMLPRWTPNGRHIFYRGANGLYCVRADGAAEPLQLTAGLGDGPGDVMPDGSKLIFTRGNQIWSLPLDWSDPTRPKPGKAAPLPVNFSASGRVRVSSDGRWMTYMSGIAGRLEVFVRPARAADGDKAVWQISTDGGVTPVWSPRGGELLYRDRDRRIVAVPFSAAGDAFVPGKPRFWIEKAGGQPPDGPFDIASDGKRLLFLTDPEGLRKTTPPSDIIMLLNFFDELKRRVPGSR